jgi:hypothetical protein
MWAKLISLNSAQSNLLALPPEQGWAERGKTLMTGSYCLSDPKRGSGQLPFLGSWPKQLTDRA